VVGGASPDPGKDLKSLPPADVEKQLGFSPTGLDQGETQADFFIILLLPVANGGVGFSEEHQAGKAIAALKAKLAIEARVLRGEEWVTPPARAGAG
jgi:magnesium-transporting ATPase (P-type)